MKNRCQVVLHSNPKLTVLSQCLNSSFQQMFNGYLLVVSSLKRDFTGMKAKKKLPRTKISNFKLIYSSENVTKRHLLIHTPRPPLA